MFSDIRLRERDAAGRIMDVRLPSGRKMRTPTFFPVYNPNIPLITPEELRKEFGWNEIITNAYILWKHRLKGDVHDTLNFEGVVMVDSGAYQLWMYGDIEITNEEIVEFINTIKPDIGTFLDIITPYNIGKSEAERAVKETLKNAEYVIESGDEDIVWIATVQGSEHLDIVRMCAEGLRELNFGYYAVGTLKNATGDWLFEPNVDYTMESVSILPRSRPLHMWGLGHPAVLPLFVYMGVDTFDSASYALYAKDERVMFPWGTERLDNIEYLTGSPYEYTREELLEMDREERVKILAKHNLWVILNEIKQIRNAIKGGYLTEYVQERVRSHPGVYRAYIRLLERYGEVLSREFPYSKRHGLFPVGEEFPKRPEVRRAVKLISRMERDMEVEYYGSIPRSLTRAYPFGNTVGLDLPAPGPEEFVRGVIEYQWGAKIEGIEVEVRRGMPRKVYLEGEYIGMIRPGDGMFVPSFRGGEVLKSLIPYPFKRVVVDEVAEGPVSEGKSVFTKFIIDHDPDIYPYQEVLVVNDRDELLATGKTVLSSREMEEFESHVAVKIRHARGS